MRPYRIIKDFMRLKDNDLVARAANVASSMKGNANFPNPVPPLEELDAVILAYSASLPGAQSGDRLKGAIKTDAKTKLRSILSFLAYYVESIAHGNKVILLSSGYKISSGVADPPAVDVINDFRVQHGNNSGQMKLSATRIKGVGTYSFFFGIADGDKTIYDHVTKTRVRAVISGLQVGKPYSFYMEAIGGNEKSVQSIIITKVVS